MRMKLNHLLFFSLFFLCLFSISFTPTFACVGVGGQCNYKGPGPCCAGLACTNNFAGGGNGTCSDMSNDISNGNTYSCTDPGGGQLQLNVFSSSGNTDGTQLCSYWGLSCSPFEGCYDPNIATCAGQVNGWCQSFQGCTSGSNNAVNSNSYECGSSGYVCCRAKQCTDVSGAVCSKTFVSCATQYGSNYMDYNNGQLDSTCGTANQCCVKKPNCNGGAVYGTWSSCGGAATNTCNLNNGSQSRSCTYTTYNGSTTCIQTSCGTQSQSCTYGNCSTNYTCSGGTCTTNIYANVYTDYNHTATNNGGAMNGVNISDGGGNTFATGSNGWAAGQVIFSAKATGNYTISMATPTNFQATSGTSHAVSLTNTSGNVTTNFYVTPLYSISGNVYYDANHNQKNDTGDSSYGSGTITISGGPSSAGPITVAGNGTWSTPTSLLSGTYTVSYSASSLPSGYSMTTPSSWTVTVGNPAGSPACQTGGSLDASCGGTNNGSISNLNFGINEPYQISGRIFNDINLNTHYDSATDSAYTASPSIHITGGTINMTVTASAADGTYSTGQILPPGSYTVSYITTLPTGYIFKTPSSYLVTVGYSPACNAGGSPDGTCGAPNTGSINNLNFGLTNENSHFQTACYDLRMDNSGSSTIDNFFPAPGTTCGGLNGSQGSITNGDCSTGAGIPYTCNGTMDFGLGSPNATNQVVGGATYPECYTPPGINDIKTSYEFLMATAQSSNISMIDMNNPSVCGASGIADCVLPVDSSGNPNLPKGIYHANGNVVLDMSSFAQQTYTLPAPTDPNTQYQSYIFLINGTLTITGGNFLISRGSAAIFSTSGNIEVAKDVGQVVTDPNSPSVNTPNLEGIYSADNSFIIDSYGSGTSICNADGTPLDKKLNILGVVIDNAAQTGGSLINNRDLCKYDNQCPVLCTGDCTGTTEPGGGPVDMGGPLNTVTEQLLTIMADGQFLLQNNYAWQEQKP